MGDNSIIFDLIRAEFGPTSLSNWKRKLDAGTPPSLSQLADLIEANSDQTMPSWLIDHLSDRLRNPEKKKKGRPPSKLDTIRSTFARYLYEMMLEQFQNEVKSQSISKKEDLPSPHERAAQVVKKSVYPEKSWRAVLNLLSSRK